MIVRRTLIFWLIQIISSFDLFVVVDALCPPKDDCGPYGECILDTRSCGDSCEKNCKCQPGYFGWDCSFQVEICADSVGPKSVDQCYNGGKCFMTEELDGDTSELIWKCDCRDSSGDAAIYAGPQCEFPSEVSCERGNRASRYAFCVNKGHCMQTIEPGQRHVGCICPEGYSGRHCQYPTNQIPKQELEYFPPQTYDKLSPLVTFFVVVASLLFVGGITFFGWHNFERHKHKHESRFIDGVPRIHHDADPNHPGGGDDDLDLQVEDLPDDHEDSGVIIDTTTDGVTTPAAYGMSVRHGNEPVIDEQTGKHIC